ncbi:ribosomal protein S18-alanine N-acetyltransferase [Pelomonas sp. PFR6]|uniref:[Ribosomal protein bS18]-alanine N-acetyltransferase n=2 Tax=Roseateles violae TaxID=3058042 RepID=A0ABT8DSU5_9BURK|nr:ribosomal protein S18-alanine N-acetyltransferase [Pelomonas sp. PFR6]MDN3921380.1 ribosomal protein S18-alanine N-acetyltransferase [Pelomonas sp. PFR6]
MRSGDLAEVLAIEQHAYASPWSQGNFIDSLAAGYLAFVLRDAQQRLQGYFLAMKGVDEMHLLNITVAPAAQGRGLARLMLDALCRLCRDEDCAQLWLEVRVSNERARQVYLRYGFAEVGLRRAYYPMPPGQPREDAVLMSLALEEAA